MYRQAEDSDRAILAAVGEIAAERGISRSQVALAWQFAKPVVSAPIIGATKPGHLADAVAALDVQLTADEVARLEAPYTPRHPEAFGVARGRSAEVSRQRRSRPRRACARSRSR